MPARESIDRDISPERKAFRLYLRTGRRVAFAAADLETKFNPNHDPHDGRFTSGPGGSGGALRNAAAEKAAADDNHIVKPKPLSTEDVATVHKISHTPAVMKAMDDAWKQTEEDGHEHGFFIYRDGDRYFPGETVTGSKTALEPLYGKLVRANALKGDFRQVAAWFHTHPGTYANADNADSHDQNFGDVVHGITIIKTHNRFIVGR
jgi:hypothetical protein